MGPAAFRGLLLVAAALPAALGTTALLDGSGSGSGALLGALRDQAVTAIVLHGNYSVGSQFDAAIAARAPVAIDRNLTVSGEHGTADVLDLGYKLGAAQLCATCVVTLANLTVTNERRGSGSPYDFFVGPPGGRAALHQLGVVRLQYACTAAKDSAAVLSATRRSAAVPPSGAGAQEYTRRDVDFMGRSFPDSLIILDFAADVPRTVQEGHGAFGGYTVVSRNVSRLCAHTVDRACLERKSPDACVNELIDQAQAGAPPGGARGPSAGVLAAAIAVPVAVVAALAALGAVLWRRRRRAPARGPGSKSGRGASGSGRGTPLSGRPSDVEKGLPPSGNGAGALVRAPLGCGQGWERAVCLTSPLVANVGDHEVHFGKLLGSGSFGRVYRARWADREVAVKVIEHAGSADEAVKTETALLLAFNHPNIVRAFHVATYVDRGGGTLEGLPDGAARPAPADQPPSPRGGEAAEPGSGGGAASTSVAHPQLSLGSPTRLQLQAARLPASGEHAGDAAAAGADGGAGAAAGGGSPVGSRAAGATPPASPLAAGHRSETWIILEYCDLGTLANIAAEWIPEEECDEQMLERLLLLRDAAQGLRLLHSKSIAHGDLNARNVLVSSSAAAACGMVAKLSDLGLSKAIQQQRTHRTTGTCGTLSHMPPELLRYGRMSTAADVYAFGVMMWEIYTGQAAFRKLHYAQFFEAIVMRNLRPLVPSGIPADYQLLMEHCWATEPADRPKAPRVVECLNLMIAERRQRLSLDPADADPSAAFYDTSVRGGDASVRGGDASVRGGDRSVRGGTVGGPAGGPAAAGPAAAAALAPAESGVSDMAAALADSRSRQRRERCSGAGGMLARSARRLQGAALPHAWRGMAADADASAEVCFIDPRTVIEELSGGLQALLARTSVVTRLSVPASFLEQLSQGVMELGDHDDPMNAWFFGERAELFSYRLIGSHATMSGFTSAIAAPRLAAIAAGGEEAGALPRWDELRAALAGGAAGGAAGPFLFVGGVLDSPAAALYALQRGGRIGAAAAAAGAMSLDTAAAAAEARPALVLDARALEAWLHATLSGLPRGSLSIRQFQHGQSNPTYLLQLGDQRLVLRKQPPGKLLASAHAVDREFRVLAALAGTRVPVPRALALCADRGVLGTPFYVMSFASGTIFTDPRLPGAAPAARAAVYGALADTLAALHALDPAALGLAGFGQPARYCGRQVARWAAQYGASVRSPSAAALRVAGWLRDNVPPGDADGSVPPAVVHGDYRLDNLVYDDRLEVVAVLDWELATLGNPWADVAYLAMPHHLPPALASLRLAAPLPEGVPSEAELLARYCAARRVAPPPPRDWAFYLALSCFRMLAILAGVQARAAQGNASSAAAQAISSDAVLEALADAALGIIARVDGGGSGGSGGGSGGSSGGGVVLPRGSVSSNFGASSSGSGSGGSSGGGGALVPPGSVSSNFGSGADGGGADSSGADGGGAGGQPHGGAWAAPARAAGLGAPSARAAALLERVRGFLAEHVYPAEATLNAHAHGPNRWTIHPLAEALKAKARRAGLWNLWMPADMAAALQHLLPLAPADERGALLGAGLSHLDYAHLCAAMGTSLWAPEAFNCSAPDTGNMEVLARYGSRAQQEAWLLPLLRGAVRSCFAMTEKGVASSDATNITASIAATPGGEAYELRGLKWWTSGAMDPRCKVAIFMGKSAPGAAAHAQQSMILVPMDAPGVAVLRPLTVFGYDDAPHGHAEVSFDRVVVPTSNLLLGEGRGFEIAQGRLGPGRLHHCMRLVGMAERALGLAARRALSRAAFGGPLAAQGGLREVLARQRVALEGARLLVLNAADALDRVGHKAARGEIAAAKVAAPAVALQVIDAAIQIHGGAGVSQDVPLGHLWAAARTLRIADGPDEVHLGTLAKLELEAAAAMLLQHSRAVAPSRAAAPRVVAKASSGTKRKGNVGFKWNPAQNRWDRDDRYAGLAADENATLIQPFTGSAYRAWPVVHTTLSDAGMKGVDVQEAAKLQKQGWTLVDVRLAGDFDKSSAAGSINVPMYRLVEGTSAWDQVKKLAMASFAMKATERDPDFVQNFYAAVKKNSRVLVMCAVGGTLDTNVSYRRDKKLFADPERAFGRESRSLKAIYELFEDGWSLGNIRHVEGGFQQWRYQGLPLAEDDA
ncbi:Acad10 [Scenedesmus sp. PABB004]|nr:Acad10 [Scenedesmus sp. PABB004]